MSDTTWLDLIYFNTDEKKLEEIFAYSFEEVEQVMHDTPGVTSQVSIPEADMACVDEIKKMAEEKLTFHGRHGSGGTYGSMCFACMDGDLVECDTNNNGYPVAQIHEGGAVDTMDKERALKYWRFYDSIKKKIAYIEDRQIILSRISG